MRILEHHKKGDFKRFYITKKGTLSGFTSQKRGLYITKKGTLEPASPLLIRVSSRVKQLKLVKTKKKQQHRKRKSVDNSDLLTGF